MKLSSNRAASRVRRAAALFALSLVLVAGVVPGEAAATTPAQGAAPELQLAASAATSRGYFISSASLRRRESLAAARQQPYASVVSGVRKSANAALLRNPAPMEPLDIRGTTGPFVDDSAAAYAMGLAYGLTGYQRYAVGARRYIMAWVQTTHHTRYTCPNLGSCQTSLIISRNAPGFVFAADLIAPSQVLSSADLTALRAWLRGVILPAASQRTNNWGDAGVFMRAVVTDFLGDKSGFAKAIAAWRSQADLIAADGHVPEETRRGSSGISYTQEALMYKVAVARIAARRGIDLWDYKGKQGGTLRSAVDYLATYMLQPSTWSWSGHAFAPAPGPMWELAYERWGSATYVPLVKGYRSTADTYAHSAVRWTTLTDGVVLPS